MSDAAGPIGEYRDAIARALLAKPLDGAMRAGARRGKALAGLRTKIDNPARIEHNCAVGEKCLTAVAAARCRSARMTDRRYPAGPVRERLQDIRSLGRSPRIIRAAAENGRRRAAPERRPDPSAGR